ncbi:MAG: hypothetical protein ACTSU3_03370 [Candidatus Thorarchaeota archaeon]
MFELIDFNSKQTVGVTPTIVEHTVETSSQSHILESVGSGSNDIRGGKRGGDLLSDNSASIGNNDDALHSQTTDQSAECTTVDISDWPWG